MRMIFYIFRYILFLIYFLPLFTFAWLLVKLRIDKRRRFMQFATTVVSHLLIYGNPKWKTEIKGLENIDKKKTYIILVNHASYYDIPLVNNLPIYMQWVAKYELIKMPVLGPILYFMDAILVKRGDPESAKQLVIKSLSYLRKGMSVTMFPEGTRSKDGCVAEFKEGAFLLAKKARVAILPIVVGGTFETSSRRKFGQIDKTLFKLEIMPEIPVETVRSMGIHELCNYTHDIIYSKHREMDSHLY